MNDIVLQKLDSGLLTITMNRPDRRNALSTAMTGALARVLAQLERVDLLRIDHFRALGPQGS